MKIRKDEKGLYIKNYFGKHRPGNFPGYSHAYDTLSGILEEGDDPKVSQMTGMPFLKIRCPDGTYVYWRLENAN